jgi:hypothetical protein
MKETLARSFQNQDIDRINSAMDDFAATENYLRPLPLDHGQHSLIVSPHGSERIDCLLRSSDRECIGLYDDALNEEPASSQIAVMATELKLQPANQPRTRPDDKRVMENVRLAGRSNPKGIRKVSLALETIKPEQFLPPKLKTELVHIAAKPYHEKPSLPSIAWVDRSHDPEVMAERQKAIAAFLFERVPVFILDRITTVKI